MGVICQAGPQAGCYTVRVIPGDAPMTLDDIRRRSLHSLLALGLRGGVGKLVSVASLVVLSRLLAPADFGAFAVILLPIGLLGLLADAGISAAMIRAKGTLGAEVERAGLTLRLALAVSITALALLASGPVALAYHLDSTGLHALWAMSASPLIDMFGLVPSVRLNRALRFDRLAWVEIGSLIVGQAAAVGGALAGLGLWSLVIGGLATSLTGTGMITLFAPWRPALSFDQRQMGPLLRFGLPYQAQGLLHLAIARIIPALGGLILTQAQIGYLTWAQDVARWPRIPADYVARVGFPAFARIQGDRAAFSQLIEQALSLVALTTFPAAAVGAALAPALIEPVFGAGWKPAALPLTVFLLQTPFDALATVLLPVIYAAGDARRGLLISLAWATLAWALCGFAALAPLAAPGLIAVPAALALTTVVMSVAIARSLPEGITIRWWPSVNRPLLIAAGLGIFTWVIMGRTL